MLALVAGCGLEDLSVRADLAPSSSCQYTTDARNAVTTTHFDAVPSGTTDTRSSQCKRPFVAHLLATNDNSVAVNVTGAEVRLVSEQQLTLSFDVLRGMPLANPLSVHASGVVPAHGQAVVTVEEIPLAYAKQLGNSAGRAILAEVTLHARSSDGDTVSSNTHLSHISVCAGCASRCASALVKSAPPPTCSAAELGDDRVSCVDDGC
jgi:hypothetical protein